MQELTGTERIIQRLAEHSKRNDQESLVLCIVLGYTEINGREHLENDVQELIETLRSTSRK